MIFEIIILLTFIRSGAIRDCPVEVELIPLENATQQISLADCIKQQITFAAQRNLFYTRPFDSSDPITMDCNLCDPNSTESPRWFFIQRNGLPLVEYSFNMTMGSYLKLIQTGNLVRDDSLYCLMAKGGLRIKSFDPDKVLGTYYCLYQSEIYTKYIWHHVDTYYLYDNPNFAKMDISFKASSYGKVKSLLNDIQDYLNRTYPYLIHESNLLKLFYRFMPKPSVRGLCGDVELKYILRCYVQIPRNVTDSRLLSNAELANYFLILDGVKFIADYKSMSFLKDGRAFNAAQQKVLNIGQALGFYPFDDISDIVFPCHFSLLKHMEGTANMGNPFGRINPYGLVSTQVKCPEVNPMDIIRLAMARDIGKLKMKILGEVQKSMRSVDKLFLQGSLNESLICGFAKLTGDICSKKRLDVQWRKGDFVFTMQSIVKQRVYVQYNCRLLFTEISLKDKGSYHCHRKSDGKSWNISPTTKFLIQVERSRDPLPELSEVMKYFVILILWTGFIVALWVFLSITNIRIRVNARYRAEEKKRIVNTQERRRKTELASRSSDFKYNEEGNNERNKNK